MEQWRNFYGFVDEQRYYCSETAFTAETRPVAKAVLANDVRSYVDTNITEGLTYYIAVGSVKNGVEKLSEVVAIIATNKIFRVELKVDVVNMLDSNGTLDLNWQLSGVNLVHANNEMQFTAANSYLKSNENFDWGGEWDLECDFFIASSLSQPYINIVANRYNQWKSGGIFIGYGGSGSESYMTNRVCIGSYGANSVVSNIVSKDQWHHLRCTKTQIINSVCGLMMF